MHAHTVNSWIFFSYLSQNVVPCDDRDTSLLHWVEANRGLPCYLIGVYDNKSVFDGKVSTIVAESRPKIGRRAGESQPEYVNPQVGEAGVLRPGPGV